MRRREFIAGLAGAAAWPLAARAQQRERMRRIGVVLNYAKDDPNVPPRLVAIEKGLQELGWTVGRNIQIDYRFSAADPDLARKYAAELVALHHHHRRLAGTPHRRTIPVSCPPRRNNGTIRAIGG
jgi:putative ABC transport system substrate-binding protein